VRNFFVFILSELILIADKICEETQGDKRNRYHYGKQNDVFFVPEQTITDVIVQQNL
jgi:hypothetical protein